MITGNDVYSSGAKLSGLDQSRGGMAMKEGRSRRIEVNGMQEVEATIPDVAEILLKNDYSMQWY